MRKIAVVTGTRAEYGLLKNIIDKIYNDDDLELQLIVTGTHVSKNYGNTIEEIKKDGFPIAEEIPILMDSNDGNGISKSMGMIHLCLSQAFHRLKPDILLILGDRYEIFATAATALVMNIPIAHISGGEITEGAIDEQIRHAITKMAHIHFPGAVPYAENIRKMGEEPWRIFNVGDSGIENIKLNKNLSKEDINKDLGVQVDKSTLLVTFHPVTLEADEVEKQIDKFIKALDILNKNMIITYPNSDNGGQIIIKKLKEFASKNDNAHVFESLGVRRYLSIMKLCGAVVGNSSSAIIEAPFLRVPTVNIGNRQKGRLMAENIINCSYETEEIVEKVELALSDNFNSKIKDMKSLYGEGNTSSEIVRVLKTIKIDDRLLKKKLIWS